MHDERDADDRRLLETGDYDVLFAGYFDQVVDRCFLRLRNEDQAHEVAQQVFLRLVTELRGGKTYPVPFRVVVWNVTNWTLDGFYPGAKHDAELPDDVDEPGPDAYADWESEHDLAELLAQLAAGQREVCELRYLHGLEPGEIAVELRIKPNAVYQRLFNARNELRELLRL